jgi:hypothetical protein
METVVVYKLKPCPFCGGEAEVTHAHGWVHVGCKDKWCHGFGDDRTYDDVVAAVNAWNKRATAGGS